MKILCLDGGGVFGRIQSHIVAKSDCLEKFDCFVGTSIGSVLAMSYAVGIGERTGPTFFDQWMPKIFKPSIVRRVNLFSSKYDDSQLNLALRDVFGSITLGQAKKPVFITAASIGQRSLKVFSSENFDDKSFAAWEACRCSVAAPTYFEPWNQMVDGGTLANNPSMVGVAGVTRVLKISLNEIEVFSIGTGVSGSHGSGPENRLTWGVWLIETLLSGSSDKMHDYFVRSLPVKKYERCQFVREPEWKMDSPRCMYLAEQKWAEEIEDAIEKMKAF